MKRMLLVAGLGIALTGGWVFLSFGNAADPRISNETTKDVASPVSVTPHENDRRIARWLAIDNRIVLECAKLAQERASSSDIKSMAEKLEAEHQRCASSLDSIINSSRSTTSATDRPGETDQLNADGTPKLQDRTPNRERTATLIEDNGESRDHRLMYQPTDFLSVKEAVASNLKDVARKEWDGVSGEEFDKAFVKHQVFAHEMLLSTIKAVRSNASSEFQETLDKEGNLISDHLKALREMDGKGGERERVTTSDEN